MNQGGGKPAYLTDFQSRTSRKVLKAVQYKETSPITKESDSVRVKSALGKFKHPSSQLLIASAVNWKPNTRIQEQPQMNFHVWGGESYTEVLGTSLTIPLADRVKGSIVPSAGGFCSLL